MEEISLNNRKKGIVVLIFTIVLFSWLIFHFARNNYFERFFHLGFQFWIISSVWLWLIMIVNSFLIFHIRLSGCVSNLKKEIILFPIVQNFWGYLFPVQGSVLFSIFYFKQEHNIQIGKTISINIFFLLLSMVLAGASGVFFLIFKNISISNNLIVWLFFIATFSLGLFPFLFFKLGNYLKDLFSAGILKKIIIRIQLFSEDFQSSLKEITVIRLNSDVGIFCS